MPETPARQTDLFQDSAPPQADALALFQPWLHAIRQERAIAQALAPALTPMLLAAYIDRYLTTDEAPSREALESALAAQRPDLVRYCSAWLRRRPIPVLQEVLWQGLYRWLLPQLQAWVVEDLAAPLAPPPGTALPLAALPTTVQDYVQRTPCPLEQVAAVICQETADLLPALAQALDLPQRTHTELQKLLRLRPIRRRADRPHPESPLFLTRAVAPVATGSPMLSSAQALLRPDLWQPAGENVPTYRRLFSQGRAIEHYITTSDPSSRTVEALAGDAAWQIVQQFGLPTAFVHLVFAAYATEQPEPWRGIFELRGSDLLRILGMDKRTDVPRAEHLREVARQARLLDSLGVWVVWREPNRDLSVQMSRMWDVALKITGPHEPEGLLSPTEVLLTVRPGLWAEKFLNAAGARAGTALRQFGYLAQQTLRLDPYHQELAAKLAVYLTLMSRLRSVYQVQHLLEAIEPATVLQKAAADRRRRYKYKQRWDEALLTLHEQGWQLTFDDVTYPLALRPDWAVPVDTPAHLRQLPADYWRRLLAATLTCTPPEPIPALFTPVAEADRPASRAATRPSLPPRALPPLPPPLTGSQVRQARLAKGWSQQELARRVGKSQPWVALVEQEKRTMQPQEQAALRVLMDLEPASSS